MNTRNDAKKARLLSLAFQQKDEEFYSTVFCCVEGVGLIKLP